MGNPMCRNLLKHGHKLKVYDVVADLVKKLEKEGYAPYGEDMAA